MTGVTRNQSEFHEGAVLYTCACTFVFCDFFVESRQKLRGMGNPYDKGKICNSASINNPSDRIHNEKSCWADDKIRRMSHDIHFSVVETWSG
jgi:hypothetical protein